MNNTSMVPSRYVHDTFNRYTNDTWWDVATTCVSCSGKIHIRYRSDTETIQKRIHSFRYVYDTGQEMHDTENDTEDDTVSSILSRYIYDT